jgi:hypothetical protein
MLWFPYQDEPLAGPPPPSLSAGATVRWRPLVPVDILAPTGPVRHFGRAVLDPAADDMRSPKLLTRNFCPRKPSRGKFAADAPGTSPSSMWGVN